MHIVKSAKLHNTVFIGKTNLQMDLDPGKRPGLRLMADDQSRMLYVEYKGEVGRVPYTNLVSMIPADQGQFKVTFGIEYEKLSAPAGALSCGEIHSALQGGSGIGAIQGQSANIELGATANVPPRKGGRPPTNAQAQTPQGHVHAGPGAGRTHD